MRLPALVLLLTSSLSAYAQAGVGWSRVQRLPTGTGIRVALLRRGSVNCSFIAADDNLLTCVRTQTIFLFPITRRMVFPRPEITSVKLSRRFLSGLAGAGIGAGIGAGVGAGLQSQYPSREDGNLLVGVVGILGGALGASLGSATDFIATPTLYRAP